MKNVLIRNLSEKDNEVIKEAMKLTGQKTASKALMQAASEMILYKKKYYDLERRFIKTIEGKKE